MDQTLQRQRKRVLCGTWISGSGISVFFKKQMDLGAVPMPYRSLSKRSLEPVPVLTEGKSLRGKVPSPIPSTQPG